MSACYESITRLEIGSKWRVRVWRTEKAADSVTNEDIFNCARQFMLQMQRTYVFPLRKEVMQAFVALPDVSAVEVVDADGRGCIEYVTWP